jgi:hypothetical protein
MCRELPRPEKVEIRRIVEVRIKMSLIAALAAAVVSAAFSSTDNNGFQDFPKCTTDLKDAIARVVDSSVNKIGEPIEAGGEQTCIAVCDGVTWRVQYCDGSKLSPSTGP